MRFNELRLCQPILRAVATAGYTTPTPIQAQAIPEALAGRDVLGCAQTGTGKTCAFALPILQRLSEDQADHPQPNPHPTRKGKGRGKHGRSPRALIMCPTRELASQIYDSFIAYGRNLPLSHAVVYGGVSQRWQVRNLRDGVDVLVATPGRLLDLINQGFIDLRTIEVLVLDEADRMLDMGFMPDIRKIVKMLPRRRQTLFFSATVPKEIRRLTESLLQNPVVVETAPESSTIETVTQCVHRVERKHKPRLLEHILRQDDVRRTLVFTRTKHGADKLVKHLRRSAINADAIHGNKTQNARARALRGFKSGSTTVLIATDIASRGIDVDEITHVINFDMPIDPETYVHRIGRTARAGASGIAVSFCDRDERKVLRAIEKRTRIRLEIANDTPAFASEAPTPPREQKRNDHSQNSLPNGGFRKSKPKRKFRKSGETEGQWKSKTNGRSQKVKANGHSSNSDESNDSWSASPTNRSERAKPNRKNRKASPTGGKWKAKPGSGSKKSKPSRKSRKASASGGNWKTKSTVRSGNPASPGNTRKSSPTGGKRKFSSTGRVHKPKSTGRKNTARRSKVATNR